MKRVIILLLLVFVSLLSVEAQGVIKRNKPSQPKEHRQDPSLRSRPASSASFGDGMLRVGDVSYKMVLVVSDSFYMGATPEQSDPLDWEKPVHSVTLSADYYLGETEVTQALWREVMGDNPSYFKGDDLPVENVSYYDCMEFVRHLNELTGLHFRLPTEAEWEYAARGGNKSRHYLYAGSNNIDDVAWCRGNSGAKTHPVKSKQPNELGLYDMSGNVYEWCRDWFGDYSSAAQTDPTGPTIASYRVMRGGCCIMEECVCRVAYRCSAASGNGFFNLGFRLALSK